MLRNAEVCSTYSDNSTKRCTLTLSKLKMYRLTLRQWQYGWKCANCKLKYRQHLLLAIYFFLMIAKLHNLIGWEPTCSSRVWFGFYKSLQWLSEGRDISVTAAIFSSHKHLSVQSVPNDSPQTQSRYLPICERMQTWPVLRILLQLLRGIPTR